MKEAYRQHGTIESVRFGDEDGRFISAWAFIDFGGSRQGFGGSSLGGEELLGKWKAELAALFGVQTFEELVGKRCWALRCFSGWNENIEGIEAMDGRRFTATDFFHRHLGRPVASVLEARRESHRGTIASLTRRINDETRILAGLEDDYVDWNSR